LKHIHDEAGSIGVPGLHGFIAAPSLRTTKMMPAKSLWKTFRTFALGLLCLTATSPAQVDLMNFPGTIRPPGVQLPGLIRVSTSLIMVPVSVTDGAGRAVDQLTKEDFQVAEDGKIETIAKMAEAGQSSLQVTLLFDLSASVHDNFEFEKLAAIHFLQKVWKPGDAVTLIAFDEKQVVSLHNSMSLEEAFQILGQLQPGHGATAFFDAVAMSARLLRESATPEIRQAEVVLSDGEDNRSSNTLADALREIQHSNSVFYSINPGGNSIRLNDISLKGQQNLVALASQTGGTAYISSDISDLDRIFGRIAAELRAQYLLCYYSSNPRVNGEFRQIEVSVPGRPDLRIHARRGYYATRK
jgi:Ca-activated chloride channel family protein